MARKRSSGSFAGLEATKEMLAEADGMMLTAESVFSHSREIEIDLISPDFNQLRKVFEQEEIVSLAKTMAKQGQLQPILVRRDLDQRGRWIIVAGERRWRAAQVNGWRTILAIEHKGDHGVASLVENLQRVDLTPVEEARGLQRLIQEKGLSQVEAGALVGLHQSNVSALLGILSLPEDFLAGYVNSHIVLSRGALIELARIEPGSVRDRLIARARAGELTIPVIRAARQQALVGESQNGEVERQKSPKAPAFSIKTAAKLRVSIHQVRKAHRVVDAEERTELIELIYEIKAWLDTSDKPDG